MRRIKSRHSVGTLWKSRLLSRASSTVTEGIKGLGGTFIWVEETVCNELIVCLVTSSVYLYGFEKEFFCSVKVVLVHMYHSPQIHQ